MKTFILGDLHLTRHTPPQVADDFCDLLARHAGSRVVIAGDFLDLMTDAPRAERREAIAGVLGRHPRLRGAIGEHVDRGGELLLLGGNHDADLGTNDVRPALIDLVGLHATAAARLMTSPWFVRDGGLHIEHGHFYDPDNAPAHPLVVGEHSLGVHFSAEFIHPTQAHRYLLANDQTPLALLLAAFRWYGPRGPYVVYRYFHAAFHALAKSGPFYRGAPEQRAGVERHAEHAAAIGVPESLLDDVIAIGAKSTLEDFSATFARLYLDRALSTIAAGAGALALAAGRPKTGGALMGMGSMLLVWSWLNGHNRYRGKVVDRLEGAAQRIAETTGAELVVFGHTHEEALGERYANTGTFAFARDTPGRPYLEIVSEGGRPAAKRHYFASPAAAS